MCASSSVALGILGAFFSTFSPPLALPFPLFIFLALSLPSTRWCFRRQGHSHSDARQEGLQLLGCLQPTSEVASNPGQTWPNQLDAQRTNTHISDCDQTGGELQGAA